MSKVEVGQRYKIVGTWTGTYRTQVVVSGFNPSDEVLLTPGVYSYTGFDYYAKFFSSMEEFKSSGLPKGYVLVEEESSAFKVGDYLASLVGSLVWKVESVGEEGTTTSALFIDDENDVVDTITLRPESLETLVLASSEQIRAFDEHPYWVKKEVSDAKPGESKQNQAQDFINSILDVSDIVSVSVDNDSTGGDIHIRFEDKVQ